MKSSFTQSMAWLHNWSGLLFGWILFLIFLTGALSVYVSEITGWMQPEVRGGAAGSPQHSLALAEAHLRKYATDAPEWEVGLPTPRRPLIDAHFKTAGGEEIEHILDPATGKLLTPRATDGGDFFNELHYELRGGVPGRWFVAMVGVVLVALIITGIIIHKRIFKDFFTFRPGKGQRSWLDGHNLAGVMTLPFLLMIAYTGVMISSLFYAPVGVQARYDGDRRAPRAAAMKDFTRPALDRPATALPLTAFYEPGNAAIGKADLFAIRHRGDAGAFVQVMRRGDWRIAAVADHAAFDATTGKRIGVQKDWHPAVYAYRWMVGIHMAQFGGWQIRLVYFLSGLIGCVLIATGVVLFVVKRKARASGSLATFLRFAGRINVATIMGPIVASIGFLWANRLLPADLAGRDIMEARTFIAIWAAMALHAFVRPERRAWVEQAVGASVLLFLLPVLSFFTVGHGLFPWDSVGGPVELVAAACGGLLAALAVRIGRKGGSPSVRKALQQGAVA